jgi:hypothetical protein
VRLRGVGSVIACAAVSLALVPSSAPAGGAHEANSRLSGSACFLLFQSGLHGPLTEGGHRSVDGPLGNACVSNACWTSEVNPEKEAKECTYARGALLTLSRLSSPHAAQVCVGGLSARGGYKRVAIRRADRAAVVSDASGGGVVMAVGSTTALLTIGAKGAHGTHAAWPGSRSLLLRAAADVARRLAKRGCPLSTNACA